MATHKSAEKRARQTIRRTTRNNAIEGRVKSAEKRLRTAISTKAKDIQDLLKAYMSEAMKSVAKGISRKETASRKIARLSSQVHKSQSASK